MANLSKRILIVTAFTPGRWAGGVIFTKNLIKDISKDYDVDVVVISTQKNLVNVYTKEFYINKYWIYLKSCLFFFMNPLFIRRFSFKILIKLKAMVNQNDYSLIWFDYSQTFIYSLFFPKERKILKYHDIMLQKFLREKWIKKLLALPTYVLELLFSKIGNTVFLTPTNKDSELLKKYYNQYAININHYINDYIQQLKFSYEKSNRYFVFFGDWNRLENEEALSWFINNIDSKRNKFKIKIIGKNLNEKIIKYISNDNSYEYLGFIENPYEIISRSTCLIAPIFRGAGVKIKVIEALACGTPVIGTELAFEGISELFNKYMLRCNTINDYVEHLKNYKLSIVEKKILRTEFLKYYNNNTAGEFIRSYLKNK